VHFRHFVAESNPAPVGLDLSRLQFTSPALMKTVAEELG
jgi:hypothetical protein